MLCRALWAAAAAANQAAAPCKAAVGGPWLELFQLTVKAALQASSQGSLRASEKISTVQADATQAGRGLDCMRASSREPLTGGNAVNDGESSPSWEAASAAETDAAACRRSDGTASGALLPKYLHSVLPELRLRCDIKDTLPGRTGVPGGTTSAPELALDNSIRKTLACALLAASSGLKAHTVG